MYSGYEMQHMVSINKIYTFFKTSFKNDYEFKGESHNFWEIVFVIDGTVGIKAGENIYVPEKGQAVIHKPNEFHQIWSEFDTNPSVIVFSFDAGAFPESDARLFNFDSSQMNKLTELHDVGADCFVNEGIYVTGVKPGCEEKAEYFRLSMELLLFSLINGQNSQKSGGIRSAEIYAKAVRLMEQSPDAGFSIDELAHKCSISPSYLKKLFVKYSGCSVIDYYNRMRARLACGYLSNGKTVKETALLLGFNDQNYFSTFFKRILGTSPTEYKNRSK